ncbi:SIR2 family protein [Ulvibacterium sp.]|uniref:SIR2 family protein n=1 Tax=Ulvibacterium sp. TaxID=2665914 RepID=UPI003BA9A4D5
MVERFVKDFSNAVNQGNAAVFAGAGLSRNSGYVNWKELLRDIAKDIKLDIDKESDLISVAQYYKNEMGGRGRLNEEIMQRFTLKAKENRVMDILASLPIDTYWTTNYDHVIEDTLRQKQKKTVDVKISQENLALSLPNRDAVVYKFHGDVSEPSKAVLTKDDYELFGKTHKLFSTSLQGDLITKTFVFVGYGLSDPNLLHILSRIRILIGENLRTHYCLVRKINKKDYDTSDIYNYEKGKQELILKDLKRYGIQCVLIDEYEEIPVLFERIRRHYITNNVFIAGSCRNYGNWDPKTANKLLYNIGYKLIEKGYKISTGLIEGVGPQLVNGALNAINYYNLNLEKSLSIKTLPLIDGSDEHMNIEAKKMFQNNMIAKVGIVVFLFGNQYYDNELLDSKGVWHDYERALELNKYIIPIYTTGFSSKSILEDMEVNIERHQYITPFLSKLKNVKEPEELSDLIIRIISHIRGMN